MLQKHQPKLCEMASPSQEPGWEPNEMDIYIERQV